jgi:predicted nuclease of predicted toxin-antitoxin system
MKLLSDQNLSHRIVEELATEFPESVHVRDVALASTPDEQVWVWGETHGLTIVSKDADFEQRALLRGGPPKVIWLRVGNSSTATVAALLRSRRAEILAFDADDSASFLALS